MQRSIHESDSFQSASSAKFAWRTEDREGIEVFRMAPRRNVCLHLADYELQLRTRLRVGGFRRPAQTSQHLCVLRVLAVSRYCLSHPTNRDCTRPIEPAGIPLAKPRQTDY